MISSLQCCGDVTLRQRHRDWRLCFKRCRCAANQTRQEEHQKRLRQYCFSIFYHDSFIAANKRRKQ